MAPSSLSPFERFLLKVQIDPFGCWLWLGCRDGDGYGKFGQHGRTYRTHVFSYTFAYGEVPEGMCVLHRCDNPPCVRPSHLFLGTRGDNSRDMTEKGRSTRGEKGGSRVKMTDEKVIAMRAQYTTGKFSFSHLGRLYGVSKNTAMRVCKRQRWTHVI